jgi:hypothetical protein
MIVRCALFIGLAAASGCTDLGPTHDPHWRDTVVASLPKAYSTADFLSAAEWIPDAKGFPSFVQSLAGPESFRQGVFVLSPAAVLFLSWDSSSKQYIVMYRSAYVDLQGYRIDKRGLGQRLVISGKDYRQQSFDMTGPNGALIDRSATDEAAGLLESRVPK